MVPYGVIGLHMSLSQEGFPTSAVLASRRPSIRPIQLYTYTYLSMNRTRSDMPAP